MSIDNFSVKVYSFSGQHVREYPGAVRDNQDRTLYLEAKQYLPRSIPNPNASAITILAAHAIGFPKELYEPLFDHLLDRCENDGIRIHSIWIADASNQGASGVINEQSQGDDPSGFDHARDLLHMINTFREEFVQPIVGLGHSSGGTSLILLSLLHPRLFSSLLLLDPIIGRTVVTDFATMFHANTQRPDLWNSRAEAVEHFRTLWRHWDLKVFDLFVRHGLRETPTLLYPEPGKVTLTMPKAQEAWLYARSCFALPSPDAGYTDPAMRTKYPELDEAVKITHPFYRPEDSYIWRNLQFVRPGVCYIFPESGPSASKSLQEAKVARTGSAAGGSGGIKHGRVVCYTIKGVGHLLPFEKPAKCATVAVEWLARDLALWHERRKHERQNRDDKSIGQLALSEKWIREVNAYYDRVRRNAVPRVRQRSGAKL